MLIFLLFCLNAVIASTLGKYVLKNVQQVRILVYILIRSTLESVPANPNKIYLNSFT
jgi:hypothetical protein